MNVKKLQRTINHLKNIVNEGNIYSDSEALYCYSYDASYPQARPEIIVRPHSSGEVSKIVKIASKERIPIVPRGAGTNVSGGVLPVKGGIIIDLTGMNQILELNKRDLSVKVEPGVVVTDLQEELKRKGLFWPPDPASADACTIGGALAMNAGGMRGVKYGTTREWVLGLEVVLPDGRIIKTGSNTLKCSSGFDLTRLFVRSEGMLGIITQANLKIRPLPESVTRLIATFNKLERAGEAVGKIFEAGIIPLIIELLDKTTLKAVNQFKKLGLPEKAALLIIDVDGTVEECNKLSGKIENLLQEIGAEGIKRATTSQEMEDLMSARKAAYSALCRIKTTTIMEDIAVPVSLLPNALKKVEEVSKKHRIIVGTFGHAGDGNVHPVICTDERDKEEWKRAMNCINDIRSAALELGGTVSGEHGIGITKAPFLKKEHGEDAVEIMKRIKSAIDPSNIINPGKMFVEAS
ncbi:MAG: FAD-binding oxidoreductase [Candidatus Thorarchaeota archaeon]